MRFSRFCRVIWLIAGLAFLLAFGRDALLGLIPRPRELPRLDGATGRPWVGESFVRAGAYQQIEPGPLPPHIQAVSSWLGTDEWQGATETAWFKASRRTIYVGVAGYPQHRGCKLWAEFRASDGTLTRIECPLVDPREQWDVWEIKRPASAVAVRLCAEDFASDHAGWIAFSHPFRAWPPVVTAGYQWLQVFATTALALILVWAPGLLWVRREARHDTRTIVIIGLGPLVLAAAGLLTWVLGAWIRPQFLGLALLVAGWSAIGVRGWRKDFGSELTVGLRRALAVMALVVVAVVGKSFYSVGPQGELFRGTVSRNFEMADRIDSRYSFYVVQAVAHHWSPTSATAENLFSPWTFFSRGPFAGLATAPLVLAMNGQPPTEVPEARWQPYDASGFATYRITMIGLASTVIIALFLVLTPLAGEKWSLIAAGLLALSPFGIHEIMFTWPKWAATAWLVASFGLAHARRPLGAGLALGAGFLFHPLVLLWSPWLALWVAGRSERAAKPITRALTKIGFGTGLIVLPWMALGVWTPHLNTTPLPGQVGFLEYWKKADWQPATWDSWWRTRWMNFANTFVPLHVYVSDASYHHPKLSSAYESSGKLVRFSQMWWVSLPFALGVGLWALSMTAMARAWRGLRAATWLLVIAPALFITAYWGMDPLGLMRECGHPLAVAIIALTCIVAARDGGWLQRTLQHRAMPWLQLPETWLMLWLTTAMNPAPWAVEFAQLDSVYFAVSVVALAGAAWVLARARVEPAMATSEPAELLIRTRPWKDVETTFSGITRPPTWAILLLGVAILALRRPDQLTNPQLWAEDGIFFFQAHEMGGRAFFLELAGYLQLAPRIIAAAAQWVDPYWVPMVFVGASVGVTLYVMSRVLSPRCPLPLKGWAALAPVLVPDAAEVLLNANNVQWLLALAGVLLLISAEPLRARERWHDAIGAFVIGLTGPFSVLLLPFFVVRALIRRTRASMALAALMGLCAAVQVASILRHPQPLPEPAVLDVPALATFPGVRIAGAALFGAWQPSTTSFAAAMALTLLLAAGLAFLALRKNETRAVRLTLALVFAAMLAGTLYRTWHSMPALFVPNAASRYLFPLEVLLLWLLLAMHRDTSTRVRFCCLGAALWLLLINLPRLRIAPVPDKRWADYAPKLRAGEEVTIPINPEGWSFTFPARRE